MDDGSGGALGGIVGLVFAMVMLAVVVVMIAAVWKVFEKAGKPGWAAIIPIYNTIVMLEICGLPIYYIIGFFIPFVNMALSIYMCFRLAKVFGKDIVMTLILIVLTPIGLLMLGFGDSQYLGPDAQ